MASRHVANPVNAMMRLKVKRRGSDLAQDIEVGPTETIARIISMVAKNLQISPGAARIRESERSSEYLSEDEIAAKVLRDMMTLYIDDKGISSAEAGTRQTAATAAAAAAPDQTSGVAHRNLLNNNKTTGNSKVQRIMAVSQMPDGRATHNEVCGNVSAEGDQDLMIVPPEIAMWIVQNKK